MPTVPIINLPKLATKPRTLVLCFDGTTNYFDETVCRTSHCQAGRCTRQSRRTNGLLVRKTSSNTAVAHAFLYYQPTRRRNLYTSWHPLAYHSQIADQAIALIIATGIKYVRLSALEGSIACSSCTGLFGFSRGAYTARALAGMLYKVGLLPPDNTGFKESTRFRQTFCREVHIEFMGVWDTVSSVGVLFPRHLPFAKSNPIVKTFRHAVSLDDAKFKDHLWHVHSPDGQCHGAKHLTTQKPKVAADTEKHLTVLVSTQTASPIASFQPLPTLTESKCEGTVDITVTEPTPPTDCKTPLITPIDQPPLWPGVETDTSSSENEQPSVPVKISWHSQEKTHIEVKGSVVGREELRALGAPDVSKVYTDIKIVKSETGFGSIVTPTGPATIKKTPTLKLWNHITTKLQ
ncbi:hypothetical protein AG1IA_01537 [Rhizoctonia solani AG-1 IA]|uniref:T6SS Phospholipase effector Tle1-like catalytic domain-containing protein n=1 Tax=Thanatephorus cucumeris (strain AG1-IA) TaxID=983506 RepID=L8X5X9_THACA|nr:hypothetical protein AG1IA_01537 [Rhizoctonia solani AG-1 IA]